MQKKSLPARRSQAIRINPCNPCLIGFSQVGVAKIVIKVENLANQYLPNNEGISTIDDELKRWGQIQEILLILNINKIG